LFCCQINAQDLLSANKTIDSLIDICRNSKRSAAERLFLARKAQGIASLIDVDSITLKVGRTLALMHLDNDDLDSYVRVNSQNLELATRISDSFSISAASANLGSYYRLVQQNDTAFYFLNNALKYYGTNEYSLSKATTFYIIADIQHVAKIYDGAEVDAIKSLEIINEIEQTENALDLASSVYNLLAIISKDIGEFEQAIEYYNKSIDIAKRMENGYINIVYARNNIANTYRSLGNFDRSLYILNNLKSEKGNYIALDSSFYGTILNNIALTKVASGNFDYDEIVATYKEAENISLEYEYPNGALNALLDLSDLYLQFEQYDSVMKYASESLKMATEFSSNEAKQRALMLLSEVTPGEQGKAYLKEHIRLGDSLEAEERLVRNKIARIKFDTDQLQARNEQISRENFYLLLVSIVLLLSGILIYVIFTQRARNKELRLKQVQQEANEEIYNLMLKQQDKIEEARALEKTRVSKELHDGVLGRLFGVRLSLDSLNFTEGKDAATNRSRYVSQLKTIEEDIRKISHEMNTDFVSGSGFVDVLKELVDTQAKAYGLDAEFTASEEVNWERVSNKVKINLYRIVQESMQNIYKHAKATKMSVAISLLNDDICLEVSDNGKGFDTSRQRRGIGLKNITSRVKDLKGSVVFESKSGKGTTVRVFLPQERV
jgi:signal transduction histidine kinase